MSFDLDTGRLPPISQNSAQVAVKNTSNIIHVCSKKGLDDTIASSSKTTDISKLDNSDKNRLESSGTVREVVGTSNVPANDYTDSACIDCNRSPTMDLSCSNSEPMSGDNLGINREPKFENPGLNGNPTIDHCMNYGEINSGKLTINFFSKESPTLGPFCYKPPLSDNFLPLDSLNFNISGQLNELVFASPIMSPVGFITPESCEESPESILKNAAKTFPTPSIFRKRRNGIKRNVTPSKAAKVVNVSPAYDEQEERTNDISGSEVVRLYLTPASHNYESNIPYSKAFTAIRHRSRSKQTAVKSLEKQLEFAFDLHKNSHKMEKSTKRSAVMTEECLHKTKLSET